MLYIEREQETYTERRERDERMRERRERETRERRERYERENDERERVTAAAGCRACFAPDPSCLVSRPALTCACIRTDTKTHTRVNACTCIDSN